MKRQYYKKPNKSNSPLRLTAKQMCSGLGPKPLTMYTPIVESLRNFKWSGSCLNSLQVRANRLSSFRVNKQTKKLKSVSEGTEEDQMREEEHFRQESVEVIGEDYQKNEEISPSPCFRQNILRNHQKQNGIGGFYQESDQQEYNTLRDNQSRIHQIHPSLLQSSEQYNYNIPVAQSFEGIPINEQHMENIDSFAAKIAVQQFNNTNRNSFQQKNPTKDSYPTVRRKQTAYYGQIPLSTDEEFTRNDQYQQEEKSFIKSKINVIVSAMRQKEEGTRSIDVQSNCQNQQENLSQFTKVNHSYLNIQKNSRKPSVQHSEYSDEGYQRRNSKSTRQSYAGRDHSISASTQDSFYQNLEHTQQLERKRQHILDPIEVRSSNDTKLGRQFTNECKESKNTDSLEKYQFLENQTKWAQQQQYPCQTKIQSNQGYYDGNITKCKPQNDKVIQVKRVKKNARTNTSFEQQNELNVLKEVINQRYKKQNSLHCYLLQNEWDLAQGRQEFDFPCNQDWDNQQNNNSNIIKSRGYLNNCIRNENNYYQQMY